MKFFCVFFCCYGSLLGFSQQIPVIKPASVYQLNFTPDLIKNFNTAESLSKCNEVYKKLEDKSYELTSEDEKVLSYCDEMSESPWDILGAGCSWYCLGGGDSVTASSQLKNQGKNNYNPGNAHDLSYETAWVEGVNGNGAGEYLVYHFKPQSGIVHTIIIANGYVKSLEAWENNARVKKLKVYVNDKPYVILELTDSRSKQAFSVQPIKFPEKSGGTIKFEIMEVYPGKKYEDTVITEIYFDGPSH